ncbi:hypothetical protein [Streptomyces sp. SAI-127]|uniref:hypothetical protein n=1 Tax=Streptomyces sp. SAI-127 TaxID=2940543 RepID=UPI002476A822|nr:hypothetical protein [Streptomyces sp. SAI-127]MDH6485219.1 drug/metabolite transporter (DMT)-like permease [Streptomyces sp. SAI-127]
MGPLLALASAVLYGIVVPQFSASLEPGGAPTTGGLLSRRAHFAAVTLYPALPVILGLALLHERLSRKQVVGLAGAGVATVLLSLG